MSGLSFKGGARVFRGLPIARLLVAGELLMLAREHMNRLEPSERRRIAELLRETRGRPHSLSPRERRELADLVQKADPRGFVQDAARKVTGVPLPGKRRRR